MFVLTGCSDIPPEGLKVTIRTPYHTYENAVLKEGPDGFNHFYHDNKRLTLNGDYVIEYHPSK